jgi:hypothetical protein
MRFAPKKRRLCPLDGRVKVKSHLGEVKDEEIYFTLPHHYFKIFRFIFMHIPNAPLRATIFFPPSSTPPPPQIGLAVTVLPLCDIVIASATATFHTPFMTLAQSPEGCSSLTFPAIFGVSRANELLMMGRKLSAEEALAWGLTSQVTPPPAFDSIVAARAREMAALPRGALAAAKALGRAAWGEGVLTRTNELEVEVIKERWVSKECMDAISAFMSRRK